MKDKEKMLAENIAWVGFVDWNVRDFHGYATMRGSTYNAYLITDEKTALIDSVKAPFSDYLLENIRSQTPLDKLDYVICNHAEPDHSGALPRVMAVCQNAKLVCNAKCKMILEKHYDTSDWTFHVVKTGDEIRLGDYSLQFVDTPMAHWPESMVTYVPQKGILFSMDVFGQHYATSLRFDDEVAYDEVVQEAKTYYANILMCYERSVTKALDALDGLDLKMIAPSHGVIWRKHVQVIRDYYREWCVCTPKPKVLVMYDSMWHSTDLMARAIYDGVQSLGVQCVLRSIRATNITILATDVLDSAAVAVGSPTLNQTLMPQAAAALTYLTGLRPSNLCGFAFGSYGWGKGGAEAVEEYLEKMKIKLLRPPLKCQFVPTSEMIKECFEGGVMLAKQALEVTNKEKKKEE